MADNKLQQQQQQKAENKYNYYDQDEDEAQDIIQKKVKLDKGDINSQVELFNEAKDYQLKRENIINYDFNEYNGVDEAKKQDKDKYKKEKCPFLGTIKRHMLDFDFEKLCSVTLSNLNVYACLVCGLYFQGRGKSTHAYFHSLEKNHNIFINLHNQKVYTLPDNYEVEDVSLNDIKYNLKPIYSWEQVLNMDKNTAYSRALDGTDYLPGCVGLNNIKMTDYVNVVIQSLVRIPDLRDYFLIYEQKKDSSDILEFQTLLSKRFAELIRKIWNPKNFKGHVSPHELLQAISLRSDKRFKIGKQSDPIQLLAWFLDQIDKELLKLFPKKKSIIAKCFQGQIQTSFFEANRDKVSDQSQVEYKNYMYLTLDIPPSPLYKQDNEKSLIPHIPIYNLLKKFDGQTFQEFSNGKKLYKIITLPKYLIIHLKRFTKNNFFMEKNPTIVQFPLVNLDLRQLLNLDETNFKYTKYDLLANIVHEGKPDSGFYKCHVKHKALNQWFEIQDLHISPVMPELVSLSEAYIQVYELQIDD